MILLLQPNRLDGRGGDGGGYCVDFFEHPGHPVLVLRVLRPHLVLADDFLRADAFHGRSLFFCLVVRRRCFPSGHDLVLNHDSVDGLASERLAHLLKLFAAPAQVSQLLPQVIGRLEVVLRRLLVGLYLSVHQL